MTDPHLWSTEGPLEIRTFVSGGFGENAYLVRCGASGAMVAIDPGGEPNAMADTVEKAGATLDAVLLTHAHYDHIEGVAALLKRCPAPLYLHRAGRALYDRAGDQASMFGLPDLDLPPIDHTLEADTDFEFGECSFEVRFTPGHAPGHVILYSPEANAAFVGDVVFQGSIGRSDLPGGDFQQLMSSIREQVLTLPDSTTLYTGHGPKTTVGHERKSNPFLVPQFGGGGGLA